MEKLGDMILGDNKTVPSEELIPIQENAGSVQFNHP
jgi:hypothetical protein